jgi:hypothetical protein
VSAPDGFKRYVRLVRKLIRDDVKRTRETPGLSLWVSHGPSPRRAAHVPVGAAADRNGVAVNVREAIREAWAGYAALGRALSAVGTGEEGATFTTEFGLVFAGEGRWEAWHVPIVAAEVGAWTQVHGPDAGWAREIAELLLSSLRDVDRAAEKCPGCNGEARGVICSVCGRGGVVV